MSTEIPAFAWSGLARPVVRAAGDFLFPPRCLLCRSGARMRWLRGGVCEDCWHAIPAAASPRCEVCAEALPGEAAARCGRCLLDPPAFERLEAAAPYRGLAREILRAFKFREADFLARHLAALLASRLPSAGCARVACVPGRPSVRRPAEHAAQTLARAVSAAIGVPFAPLLRKVRATEPQRRLPLSRRAENVRGAFRARGAVPRSVLVIDDVATSGATARVCAAALRRAGAEKVVVWCFARASRSDVELEPPAGGAVAEGNRPSPPAES